MTATLLTAVGLAAAVAALALALPCAACERRRERLRAALHEWQRCQN